MMIKSRKNIGFMILLLILLTLPIVHSINLSTVKKNEYSTVRIGESAQFTILFWNIEESSFPIELSVKQASENLSVIIIPESFVIEPSLVTQFPAERGKEYVDTSQGLMEATPVRVLVKPSNSAGLGEYEVYVKAVVKSPEVGIITPQLEKTFKFTVNVTSPLTFSERLSKTIGGLAETVKDIPSRITGMVPAETATNWILLIISIIIIAFFIWFKRFR